MKKAEKEELKKLEADLFNPPEIEKVQIRARQFRGKEFWLDLKEGEIRDVTQEFCRSYPDYSKESNEDLYFQIQTQEMRAVLAGTRSIEDIITKAEERLNLKRKEKSTHLYQPIKKVPNDLYCWPCYSALSGEIAAKPFDKVIPPSIWDRTRVDTTTRRTCSKCGRTSRFVREFKEENSN